MRIEIVTKLVMKAILRPLNIASLFNCFRSSITYWVFIPLLFKTVKQTWKNTKNVIKILAADCIYISKPINIVWFKTKEYLANFIISTHIHTSLHRWDVKIIPVSIIKFIGSKEISRYYNFCLTRTKDRCEPLNFLLVGRICKKKLYLDVARN